VVVLIAVLVGLFLLRRPGGMIRIPGDAKLAGLLPRTIAFLLDAAPPLLGSIYLCFDGIGEFREQFDRLLNATQPGENAEMWIWWVCFLGLLTAYQTATEAISATTPGKRLFKLQIRTIHAQRPTLMHALVRNVIKAVELFIFFPLLVALIHPARQRIGDMIAGTVVVAPGDGPPWVTPPTRGPDQNQDD
jgi:uncharacterized RDD family membrane protein YckC